MKAINPCFTHTQTEREIERERERNEQTHRVKNTHTHKRVLQIVSVSKQVKHSHICTRTKAV